MGIAVLLVLGLQGRWRGKCMLEVVWWRRIHDGVRLVNESVHVICSRRMRRIKYIYVYPAYYF